MAGFYIVLHGIRENTYLGPRFNVSSWKVDPVPDGRLRQALDRHVSPEMLLMFARRNELMIPRAAKRDEIVQAIVRAVPAHLSAFSSRSREEIDMEAGKDRLQRAGLTQVVSSTIDLMQLSRLQHASSLEALSVGLAGWALRAKTQPASVLDALSFNGSLILSLEDINHARLLLDYFDIVLSQPDGVEQVRASKLLAKVIDHFTFSSLLRATTVIQRGQRWSYPVSKPALSRVAGPSARPAPQSSRSAAPEQPVDSGEQQASCRQKAAQSGASFIDSGAAA